MKIINYYLLKPQKKLYSYEKQNFYNKLLKLIFHYKRILCHIYQLPIKFSKESITFKYLDFAQMLPMFTVLYILLKIPC